MQKEIFNKKTKLSLFVINLLIIIFVGWVQFNYQYNNLEKKFNTTIENIVLRELINDIGSIKGVVSSLSSYYQSSTEMDSSIFQSVSNDLFKSYDYIDAIGFLTLIQNDEKIRFEQDMRDNGLYNFSIKTIDSELNIIQSKQEKPKYAPIIFIEPSNFNFTKYYGLDLYNIESLQSSFEKASKTNDVVIKDHVKIDRFSDELTLFIKSTHKNNASANTQDELMESSNGFYIIEVNFEKLIAAINLKVPNLLVSFHKYNEAMYEENDQRDYNQFRYYKKIESLENSYLHVSQVVKLQDYNITSFVFTLSLTIVLQMLLVLIWYLNKSSQYKLLYQATHDDLTGLANRRYFIEQFSKKVSANSSHPLTVVFLDIDRFKDINDTLGHDFGDKVLIEISQRLKKTLSKNDMIFRHGGDEFLILLDGENDLQSIESFIKKLMSDIHNAIKAYTYNIRLTASVGVSIYPKDGNNTEQLFKNAHLAMHKAKDSGKNTFMFYDKSMTEQATQKISLEYQLKEAIRDEELEPYYQPQYNGEDDRIIGMEVLARWINKNGDTVPPVKFIPLAEETGLIVELDRLIMKKALKQFALWKSDNLSVGRLSLNLSIKQLNSESFIDLFKELVKKHKLNPAEIELEVTEGVLMDNPFDTIKKLEELSAFGVHLSVDDFGTGYSSLAYLKKLPINKLKIDKVFVDGLPDDNEDIAIIKSIIVLSKSLKLDLIAEGVETKEQRDFLIENGCKKIQGYFYSKPLNNEGIERILRNTPLKKT